MTNQPFDPMKELEAALAVEPSPAFAARVRARVAEPRNRPVWLGWPGLAAAAVMALLLIGAGVWRASVAEVPTLPVQASAKFPGEPVAPSGAPTLANGMAPAVQSQPMAAPRVRTSVAPAPEVLVPPDQAIALNRLLAGMRERRSGARIAAEAPPVVIEELPQIIPVHLEPIRIEPLVPNSPPSGGKEKER